MAPHEGKEVKYFDGWLRPCGESSHCVEVRLDLYGEVVLRSSAKPWKQALLTREEFFQFVQDCKDGKFDSLTEDAEAAVEAGPISLAEFDSVALASSGGYRSRNVELLEDEES